MPAPRERCRAGTTCGFWCYVHHHNSSALSCWALSNTPSVCCGVFPFPALAPHQGGVTALLYPGVAVSVPSWTQFLTESRWAGAAAGDAGMSLSCWEAVQQLQSLQLQSPAARPGALPRQDTQLQQHRLLWGRCWGAAKPANPAWAGRALSCAV